MDLELLLLAFASFWKISVGVRCYICDPEMVIPNSKILLCQYFNGSEAFITDCPQSTVCFKKETSIKDLGDPANSVTRGCAKQIMSGYQEKINGKWRQVEKIHEIYEEGCEENSNEFDTPAKTRNCFCRGDLCNSGTSLTGGVLVGAVGLLIVMVNLQMKGRMY